MDLRVSLRRVLVTWILLVCVSSCSTGMESVLTTLKESQPFYRPASVKPNNSGYQYLRVVLNDKETFLALGYEDPSPQGPIEVWYSSAQQVLKIQNGRLKGITGLNTEWSQVDLSLAPAWDEILSQLAKNAHPLPYRWVRTRDEMPGYKVGIQEQLEVIPMASPSHPDIREVDLQKLIWFEEKKVNDSNQNSLINKIVNWATKEDLPASRYAVMKQGARTVVVYSEQCIKKDICFKWQRWNAPQLKYP